MKRGQRGFLLLVGLLAGWIFWHPGTGNAQGQGLIISRVGLSQAQGTTFLTMILSRAEQPKIQPVVDRQAPQLMIDFPHAKVFDVPVVQAGDQKMVKQVRTTAMPGQGGVRIILDLVPGRPYTFWRAGRPGPKGGHQFMVGLKPDAAGSGDYAPGLVTDRKAGAVAPEAAGTPPPTRYETDRQSMDAPPSRTSEPDNSGAVGGGTDSRRPLSGSLSEIYQLMPAAGPLLEFLERNGWSVQKDAPGRSGVSGSRKFLLANANLSQLSVVIEHIPSRAAGSPGLGMVALSTDKMADSDADKYRQKSRWDMATIKKHYEDIGDYYDDGLKPLRIILRERSKAMVLREWDFYRQFIDAAVPQKPGLADQIKKHVDERVNKRLEGAQFTESENPLVIMDMVDFYTLRVYYVGK